MSARRFASALLALPIALACALLPSSPSTADRHVVVGVSLPGGGAALTTALAGYTSLAGSSPEVVGIFTDWDPKPFPLANATVVTSAAATPLITWEPRRWSGATITQPLERIAGGEFDSYVTAWATAARTFGHTVYLRFGHEMNGNWYPWGRDPSAYVAAFRHVHDLFVAAGASNVRWVWGPGVMDSPSLDPRPYFPGEEYVDVVGLDGYNWGSEQTYAGWRSFSSIFGATLDALADYTSRPVWVTETGSTESGGDKAAWIRDMFATVASDSRYAGLLYFDQPGTGSWPLTTSVTASAAYRNGLAALRGPTPAPVSAQAPATTPVVAPVVAVTPAPAVTASPAADPVVAAPVVAGPVMPPAAKPAVKKTAVKKAKKSKQAKKKGHKKPTAKKSSKKAAKKKAAKKPAKRRAARASSPRHR